MNNLHYFITKYRGRPLLLDTNLLILLVVGNTDPALISSVKTTRSYLPTDYNILHNLVKEFRLITTAHVLAETSNLCEKIDKHLKLLVFDQLASIITVLPETFIESRAAAQSPAFIKFGLTDTILIQLSKQGMIILTDDFELHGYLLGNNATAANMNHFRSNLISDKN